MEEAKGSSPFSSTNKITQNFLGYFIGRDSEHLPKVKGENCQWQFARPSSDANCVCNREVAGSPAVTESL